MRLKQTPLAQILQILLNMELKSEFMNFLLLVLRLQESVLMNFQQKQNQDGFWAPWVQAQDYLRWDTQLMMC